MYFLNKGLKTSKFIHSAVISTPKFYNTIIESLWINQVKVFIILIFNYIYF